MNWPWIIVGFLLAILLTLLGMQWFLLPDGAEVNDGIKELQEVAEKLEGDIAEQRAESEKSIASYKRLLQDERELRRAVEEEIESLEKRNRKLREQRHEVRQETEDQVASLPDMEDLALAAMIREEALEALNRPIHFQPLGTMFQTDRAGAEAIAESFVQWSACRQELGMLESQLSNCQAEIDQVWKVAESWKEQHQSLLDVTSALEDEMTVKDQLEENLRQRIEAQRMRAKSAEDRLFWKQVERFLEGAAIGGVIGAFAW